MFFQNANQLILNCEKFSYFRSFTHDIVKQNTTDGNIMYIYSGHSASTLLQKGEGIDEESSRKWHRKEGVQSKKWRPSHKFCYALFSATQSFLLGFSGSSDNIIASNKKSSSKKDPITLSEPTISYLDKNTIILLLCQCGLPIHTCVSEN